MPQDRPVPGSAEDWLARAEGDLALVIWLWIWLL